MIKVKDGYAKLIGTTYQGSAILVLLSNGGNLEFSSATKANTLVLRNASLHIYATYFNSAISDEALTDIGSVYVRNTSDTFIRRISKTQFYSIIDNKFVTLDTALTITGVKTFSTGLILADNATITLNLNSTSNYTTAVKWLKGGTSLGTYNPSIGLHNTGGDGTGSICILPYPTETSPWDGTVGLFISKGVLRLDGKSVAIAENYYTKTESDNRYVNVTGDTMTGPLIVKASITGTLLISNIADGTAPLKVTSKTVVTNLNSDLLDGYHETSFFRARGSLTIASSIPTTTELSSNNNLSGSWTVSYPGASGHLVQFNTGGGSTRYMQFYSHYSGSLYWRNSTDSTLSTKSWKTIVDSANYTGIVLKIGTATKGSATLPIYLNAGTPTACSTTLGVSITGNAATATKLLTARTINGTSFNGTTNITTAYWGATRTITLSGAVTGSASVNGSLNVTITTTYQTGSIDGRYVGGNKTAGHGSSRTAYTADSYSSTFARKEFVAFAERGSWDYANNGYITTNTGVNIPLAGTAVFQWGASDTNKTLLFITPHNNSGVSNPAANEMLFYTSNGSGYTSAWTRVLTHRNYTAYTVTKTGGGASGTWGISITGSAPWANITGKPTLLTLAGITSLTNKNLNYARYNFGGTNKGDDSAQLNVPANYGMYLSLAYSDKNQGGLIFFNTVPGTTGTLYFRTRNAGDGNTVNTWKSWKTVLDSSNYTTYFNPANYVTALGTSGNYVTWTKNGTTNNLTVPYATKASYVTLTYCRDDSSPSNKGLWNTIKNGTSSPQTNKVNFYTIYASAEGPSTFGEMMEILSYNSNHWLPLLWFGSGKSGNIYYRNKDYNNNTWGAWLTILTNINYSAILDGRYANTLTFSAGKFSSKTYNGSSAITVNVPTHTSHLTNNSGFWTGTRYWANIAVSTSSSTGTSPTFSTAYTSNWFRSTGNTGWYSETYGGGWHMNDTTYIRAYGSKRVYNANTSLYAFYTSGGMTAAKGFWHSAVNSNSYVLLAGGSYKAVSDFATKSHTHSYLPLSGGTMTGSITFPNNAGIIQNQNSGSNYTKAISWNVSGATKAQIGSHNTGGDGTGSITILPYTTTTDAWSGSVGLFVYKGGAKIDGAQVLTSGNYTGTLDGRYVTLATNLTVSGVKTFSKQLKFTVAGGTSPFTVSSPTVVANLNSDLLDGYHASSFAKGSAGASNKGVYVAGGTVNAMTYYLNANVNSGTYGKLAYYSSATTVAAYSLTVGSLALPIYLDAGSPYASPYSFTGTPLNPVIVWCGEIYRNSPYAAYWSYTKKGGCCDISFTTSDAGSNGNLVISIPNCEPYAAFCSTVRIFDGPTSISAVDATVVGRSAGMGDYMTLCNVSGTTGSVYIRKFSQQNAYSDSWTNGELRTTETLNGNKPVARFYLMIVGIYI